MAASQIRLIGALLSSGNLEAVARAGVDSRMLFECPDAVTAFDFIVKFHGKYGRVPSRHELLAAHPGLDIPEVEPDALMPCVDDVLDDFKYARMRNVIEMVSNVASKHGMDAAIDTLYVGAQKLKDEFRKHDEDLLVEPVMADVVLSRYQEIEQNEGLIGIPWPWSPMNQFTQGIADGKYYVVWGVQKSMKTWLTLYLINHIYDIACDERVALYLRELTVDDALERLALLRTGINSWRYQKGKLLPTEKRCLEEELRRLHNMAEDHSRARMVILKCPRGKHLSPSDLRAKVRSWGARTVFADSIYLMTNDRGGRGVRSMDWKNVGDISGALADLAHDDNLRVFATSQEHERTLRSLGPLGGATMGYASRIMQDADLAIHLLKFFDRRRKTEASPNGEPELGMMFTVRGGVDIPDFTIRAVPAESFDFKHEKIRNFEDEQSREEKARFISGEDSIADEVSWGMGRLGSFTAPNVKSDAGAEDAN